MRIDSHHNSQNNHWHLIYNCSNTDKKTRTLRMHLLQLVISRHPGIYTSNYSRLTILKWQEPLLYDEPRQTRTTKLGFRRDVEVWHKFYPVEKSRKQMEQPSSPAWAASKPAGKNPRGFLPASLRELCRLFWVFSGLGKPSVFDVGIYTNKSLWGMS